MFWHGNLTKRLQTEGPRRSISRDQCTIERDKHTAPLQLLSEERLLIKCDGTTTPVAYSANEEKKRAKVAKDLDVYVEPLCMVPTYPIGSAGPNDDNLLYFEQVLKEAKRF